MSESWTGSTNGWDTASGWSGDTIPNGPTADATIAGAGAFAVTIEDGETFTVDSATLDNAAATLELARDGALLLGGVDSLFVLAAGTLALDGLLADGTIDLDGGVIFAQSATFQRMTVEGALDITNIDASFGIEDGLTVVGPDGAPGTIDVTGAGDALNFADNETLTHVLVELGSASNYNAQAYIVLQSSLTIGAGSTIEATGEHDITYVEASALTPTTLINNGLFEVDPYATASVQPAVFLNNTIVTLASGGTLIAGGSFDNAGIVTIGSYGEFVANGSFDNSGSITIDANATLLLRGPFSAATIGTIAENAGLLLIEGVYDNTGAVLAIEDSGAFANAALGAGGVIEGGTILEAGGTLAFHGGTFDGVTLGGTIFNVGVKQQLTIEGSLGFGAATTFLNDGTLALAGGETLALSATASLNNGGLLEVEATTLVAGTVAGLGEIEIGGGGDVAVAAVSVGALVRFDADGASPAGTLTLAGTSFGGIIEGLGQAGTDADVDLTGVTATALAYDALDGVLSLLDGGQVVTALELAGVPSDPQFGIASDGQGGVLLTAPQTRSFAGSAGADWYAAASWTTNAPYAAGAPSPGDQVIVAGTVSITAADVALHGTLDDEHVTLDARAGGAVLMAADEAFGAALTLNPEGLATLALTGNTTFDGVLGPDVYQNDGVDLTDTGVFTNDGTFDVVAGPPSTLSATTIVNDGIIGLSQAALTLAGGVVAGSGVFEIGALSDESVLSGGALVIDSGVTVAASQQIDFTNGSFGTLVLDLANPGDVAAQITDFTRNQKILLENVGAASETYDATTGTLAVYASGATAPSAVLDVGPGYVSSNFTLTAAGTTATVTTNRALGDGIDQALQADQARSTAGVDGTGITVGIISDSFNHLGGMAADIASGDLPAGVNILHDSTAAGSTDEGRSMAELVHRIAPGATIDFYDAGPSQSNFATAVTSLAGAGADIIVDDISYPDEPYFQDASPIDAAISQVMSAGVDYFTSAGNEGDTFYQGTYSELDTMLPGLGEVRANDFGGGNALQAIDVQANTDIELELQWEQPFPGPGGSSGAQNSLKMVLYNATGSIVAVSDIDAVGGEPVQYLAHLNGPSESVYHLAIVWDEGSVAPGTFKYINQTDGELGVTILDPNADQGSGTSDGHENLPGVNVVGAVDYIDTPAFAVDPAALEDFSSDGPGDILIGPDGQTLATPIIPATPDFLSVDGAATDPLTAFYGTSSAAPTAAAVAALMLQANPKLSLGQVSALLEQSASTLGLPADEQGAGLIDAATAVALAETTTGAACYGRGTRIATAPDAAGTCETPVEALRIGDLVRTASGALRPVRWIGHRSYDGRFIARNRDALPIVIAAGALADGVPTRDLCVSPKHAMFLDGVLVPAERLVNGCTIRQLPAVADITYFHVELASHDILLAEGAPAESFSDCDSRGMFSNAAEFPALYPAARPDRWAFCAPRMEEGSVLADLRRRLAARAGLAADHLDDAGAPGTLTGLIDRFDHAEIAGWAFDPMQPGTAVRLAVMIDGVPRGEAVANGFRADLRDAGKGQGRCAFSHRLDAPLGTDVAHVVELRRADGAVLCRTLAADPVVPGPLDGFVEIAGPDQIEGWALDTAAPGAPVRLEILDGDRVVAAVRADGFRADLAAAGKGTGHCRFSIPLAASGGDRLTVRRASDRAVLARLPAA